MVLDPRITVLLKPFLWEASIHLLGFLPNPQSSAHFVLEPHDQGQMELTQNAKIVRQKHK